MVAGSITVEIETPVEAKRLWNALVKDGHNLVPKQASEIFAGITILEGDGGVGTVKKVEFTAANKDFSYVKESVQVVDEANFVYVFIHVEGGQLGKTLASVKFTMKFTPKAGGGCVYTSICEFDTLPGVPRVVEQEVESKAKVTSLFKKIEAYLLANPTAYC